MLQVNNVSLQFGGRKLFEDVNLKFFIFGSISPINLLDNSSGTPKPLSKV